MLNFPVMMFSGAAPSPPGSWTAWDGSADGSNVNIAVDVGTAGPWAAVVNIDSTHFLGIYEDATNHLKCIIGTVSGTGITYSTAANIDSGVSGGVISAVLFDIDKIFVAYKLSGSGRVWGAIVSTGSGTPALNSSQIDITGESSTINMPQAIAVISSNLLFFAYDRSAGMTARTLSISGNTITPNAQTTILTPSSGEVPACACYDVNKIAITYKDPITSFPSARIINISGVNIGTLGTATSLESIVLTQSGNRIIAINNSSALVGYRITSGISGHPEIKAIIISLSGNTVTPNTPQTVVDIGDIDNAELDQMVLLNASEAMISYDNTANTYAKVLDWSGTTITANSQVQLQTADQNADGFKVGNITKLDNDTVCNSALISGTVTNKVLKRA